MDNRTALFTSCVMYMVLSVQMRCTISLVVMVILFFFWGSYTSVGGVGHEHMSSLNPVNMHARKGQFTVTFSACQRVYLQLSCAVVVGVIN